MGTAKRWIAACLVMAFACGSRLPAADFELSPSESKRIAARGIILRANLDAGQRRGTARAAILIKAAPATVFQMMTSCGDAMQYVPHMRECRVRDRAADNSWQLVEHEIDFGWYAPRVRYVFRADFVADSSITFRQVSGDFKAYEGVWEFESAAAGAHTLLRYRAYIDPPGFIPNWLARSTFKRELPQMLADLRRLCETKGPPRAETNASSH